MASRRITDLCADLRRIAKTFLSDCEAAGLDVVIICTYRSNSEQAELYASGRNGKGVIVTNCKPGQSKHNATEAGAPGARAFDAVPITNGKVDWSTDEGHCHQWARMGQIGQNLGLEWGGAWLGHLRDFPHFQLPD
jgi:peptidoglycan L-alanyl-D-glutamate endopeptidase CwlK